MSHEIQELLKKHGYQRAGRHSAVKTCLWLKRSINNKGQCYKSQFYGITSHRCIQMTPTLQCNQRCLHCWRAIDATIPKTPWDPPEVIVDETLRAQQRLTSGYGGSDQANKKLWEESKNPLHVAISLAGEPTLYPYLSELINIFHKKGMTTFVVSNGTHPEVIREINPTQLYLSLTAPDRETYQQTCKPEREEMWEDLLKSLKILSGKKGRTTIRITLIEGLNDTKPEEYAKLIKLAKPDYIEIKSYMHLGFSRKRLERNKMPTHTKINKFAQKIIEHTEYKWADENEPSRVVLLSKDGKTDKL
ncbi:4-demethylwyosine synthase TYW1 [Methanosarcinales archaeon ex4572_44]|nr:MAG: 4-demethylwyosine synthase TYW1 [Methanosarcinales archaeon ex4484_138]PHP45197.1 MAG: 4-demethylwyosine synthase TYW1 [Methanosarcinales archaeon ex4572_44]RLG27863.1 MAG: 4-demethylwyosine synthase TYW1 [Methanosarcinales archaeon]